MSSLLLGEDLGLRHLTISLKHSHCGRHATKETLLHPAMTSIIRLTAFYGVSMAAFVLLTLYLVALPSKFPAWTDAPEGWSVATSIVLANIAASGACILALLLITRL